MTKTKEVRGSGLVVTAQHFMGHEWVVTVSQEKGDRRIMMSRQFARRNRAIDFAQQLAGKHHRLVVKEREAAVA